MNPILFLDIDGVLLPERAMLRDENALARRLLMRGDLKGAGRAAVFDRDCVARLNALCLATGALLVVHSDWRSKVGQAETHQHLVDQGVDDLRLHPEPCPWNPRRGIHKPDDIISWVAAHNPARWAAVDDDFLFGPGGTIPQVNPDPVWGLQDADVEKLATLLTR